MLFAMMQLALLAGVVLVGALLAGPDLARWLTPYWPIVAGALGASSFLLLRLAIWHRTRRRTAAAVARHLPGLIKKYSHRVGLHGASSADLANWRRELDYFIVHQLGPDLNDAGIKPDRIDRDRLGRRITRMIRRSSRDDSTSNRHSDGKKAAIERL